MDIAFNPYVEWLQIPPANRRPNHYELLGLPLFEENQDQIKENYLDRFARVRQYETSRFSDEAIRLMGEVAQAYQCLADRNAKREYDERLRRERASTRTAADGSPTIITEGAPSQSVRARPLPSAPKTIAAPPIGVSGRAPPVSLPAGVASSAKPSLTAVKSTNVVSGGDVTFDDVARLFWLILKAAGVALAVFVAAIVAFEMLRSRSGRSEIDSIAPPPASVTKPLRNP